MKRAMILSKENKLNGFSSSTKTSRIKSTKEQLKFLFRESLFYSYHLFIHLFI